MTPAPEPTIAPPPMASRYRAFISYSHADESWAKWIETAIESYSVPRTMVGRQTQFGPVPSRVRPVFRDRDELAAGPDLSARIRQALGESLFLIVICSPKAAASTWVNEEIRLFKATGREDRILCLLVDGDPASSFPPALKEGSSAAIEPLAADPRPHMDGRDAAKLKIIASLVCAGFDELRQREQRRIAALRLMIAASATLGVMLFALFCVGLADAGAPLPGRRTVQMLLDRHHASLFRRIPSAMEISAALEDERLKLLPRVVDDLRASRFDFEAPTEAGSAPKTDLDVWAQSQALCAVFACPESSPEDLRVALRALDAVCQPDKRIDAGGKKYGWRSRWGYQYTAAPPTLWTAAALALALGGSPGIGAEQKARFTECLEWAQDAALTYHPVDDGGWNHFPNEHDPSAHDTYTTLLALNALLIAKEASLGWAGSIERRDKLLASTRQYLIDQFESNPRNAGWNSDVLTKGVPLDGLTLQAFALLLRAESDGCGALPDEMLRAIRRRLVDLGHRSFDFPIASSRFNRRFAGDHGQMFDEPVLINFLWYPWAVAACREWLALAPGRREAPEDVTGVTRSLAHLVVDLHRPVLADYSGGEVYRASETVYAFSRFSDAKPK